MMGSGVCLSGGLSWSLSLFLGEDLVTGNISLEDITVAKLEVAVVLVLAGDTRMSGEKVMGTSLRPRAMMTASSGDGRS